MRHRQLPHELRERVRRFIQYKWLATRGVNEESILQALPADLRRDIKRHLCLGLVRRVIFFNIYISSLFETTMFVILMMDNCTMFLYIPNF
jgi:cyclic nucleotide gated channel